MTPLAPVPPNLPDTATVRSTTKVQLRQLPRIGRGLGPVTSLASVREACTELEGFGVPAFAALELVDSGSTTYLEASWDNEVARGPQAAL